MLYLSSWLSSASMFVTEKVTLHGYSRIVKVTEREGKHLYISDSGENKSKHLAHYLSSVFYRSCGCASHGARISLLNMHATRHNHSVNPRVTKTSIIQGITML